jgi:hypothetical protein
MGDEGSQYEVPSEISHPMMEFESPRDHHSTGDPRYLDAHRQMPATTALANGNPDNTAVAVLEHIYRDMIMALQQMYRDTIAAKDDALAGRDRELETKDALIEHLKQRAEDAEARASQAMRYIAELDGGGSLRPSQAVPAAAAPKRRGLPRLFG